MEWKIKSVQKHPWSQEKIIKHFLASRSLPTDKLAIKNFLSASPVDLEQLIKQTQVSRRELKKATTLIKKSIVDSRPIIVYGDYDADGISSTAILWQSLHQLGAKALPFIPHRLDHGYGLSEKGVQDALKLFPKSQKPLLITVDNGITATNLVQKYQSQDIDFVIVDHHQPPDIPPQPRSLIHSTKVSAATLAYLLSLALGIDAHKHLDLVALAAVCDSLPLVGLNRQLVMLGLKEINLHPRPGLKALLSSASFSAGSSLDTYHLGFILGPRLNAAGRIGNALDALRLLCTQSEPRAIQLAINLESLNQQRQALTQDAQALAQKQLEKSQPLPAVLIVSHKDFHEGIIGLIAARLCEKYNRPAIALALSRDTAKASVRSPDNINIINLLQRLKNLFIELGGHAGAAGFVIKTKDLPQLAQKLEVLSQDLSLDDHSAHLDIDLSLNPDQDLHLLHQALDRLAPFGQGFVEPLFALHRLILLSARSVGNDSQHLQLKFSSPSGQPLSAIAFNQTQKYNLKPQDTVSVVFQLKQNNFRGQTSLQFHVKDIKKDTS